MRGKIGRFAYREVVVLLMALVLCGCNVVTEDPMKKLEDLEYTVQSVDELPKEVLRETEKRKEKEFKMTFRDGENLYVCVGYGEQDCGGYSIRVLQFYEANNGIYVETELLGPKPEDAQVKQGTSYPYMVLKTEYRDKPVIFL